jgi:NAD+ synthase
MTRLRLALAQVNPRAGDPAGNAARLRGLRAEAAAAGADVLLTPQGSLSGWPLQDLAREGAFRAACAAEIARLAAETADGGPAVVLGAPFEDSGRLHDGIFVLDARRILARRARHEVTGEEAFAPGPAPGPVALRGVRLGLMTGGEGFRADTVPETLAETGADLLVTLGAFPFAPEAADRRMAQAVAAVVGTGLGFVFAGLVGAEDGIVQDGGSFALNFDRSLALQLPLFASAMTLSDWTDVGAGLAAPPQPPSPLPAPDAAVWQALVLGLTDQVRKSGLPGLVLPWPAEHAAALLARLAVEAVGAWRIGVPGGLRLTAAHRVTLLQGAVPAEAEFAPFLDLSPGTLNRFGAALPADPEEPILDGFARGDTVESLSARGFARPALLAAWRCLARAEAARRRAPPCIHLGGRLPRLPLTQAFVDQIA